MDQTATIVEAPQARRAARERVETAAPVETVRLDREAIACNRGRRVLSLLALLWILNAFDLTYTLLAHEIGGFHELNPVARPLISSWGFLVAFKVGAVAGGSLILLALRRHLFAELASWLMCGVYTALAFHWMWYYLRLH